MSPSQLAASFQFFDPATRQPNFHVIVFNVWHCYVCAAELLSPEPMVVTLSDRVLLAHGIEPRTIPPDSGAYSAIYEATVCTRCHQRQARRRH